MHSIGPIDVYFPSAGEPCFWVCCDLAGVFGLEFNQEAAQQLEAWLTEHHDLASVDIDQEADTVLIHANDAASMEVVLTGLRSLSTAELFDDADLARLTEAMRKWKRPKRVRYGVGDLFAIDLGDDHVGAVQVAVFPQEDGAGFRGSPLLLLLDVHATSMKSMRQRLAAGAGVPAAALITTDEEIEDGDWPAVGHRAVPPDVDLEALCVREKGHSKSGSRRFLCACLGIDPWDDFSPTVNDTLLVPGYAPVGRRYRREVFEHRLREVFGESGPEPVETGPATVHILIAYPGRKPPRPFDAVRLSKLANGLREVLGDEVYQTMSGGGIDGYLDLFVQVPDVALFRTALDTVASSLDLADEILSTCTPQFDLDWRAALSSMSSTMA